MGRTAQITLSPSIFKGQRGAPDTEREGGGCFYEKGPFSPDEPIPGKKRPYKERNSSRGPPPAVSEFGWLPHLVRRPYPVSGLGNINPIPFVGRGRQTRAFVCFSASRGLRTFFSDPLGPTKPMFNCCSHGPFSSFGSSRLSLEYLLYHQIGPGGGSAGSARHLQRTPPQTLLLHAA
ncbi:hypothetical protein JTE90_014836 [Oedothorax gibbosus]|uniref:Uncharacterized protein n=1 Tax=Oedothorax gibbosus TaxID=931172 RepID=A0AAV6TDL2_9ARAC|nr:hypothetical protein JTE90_014836 [Oedothorax gibbosus]